MVLVGVGLPTIAYLSGLLFDREVTLDTDADRPRQYTADLIVADDAAFIKSISEAGLRQLKSMFLVQIRRKGRVISPVSPNECLETDDRLTFVGLLDDILTLGQRRGFLLPNTPDEKFQNLHEAVIAQSSPLVGRRVKDSQFRGRYQAAIVAVHRQGEPLEQRIGEIVFRVGDDRLLLQGSSDFSVVHRHSPDFYITTALGRSVLHPRKAKRALGIFGAVVLFSAIGVLDFSTAALIGALLAVGTGCISLGAAQRAVNLSVVMAMAAAIGLGSAVESAGIAKFLAEGLLISGQSFTLVSTLVLIYCLGIILTELTSNLAAAAILLPIALAIAEQSGLPTEPVAIVVALSVAISMMTPLGIRRI